MVRSRSLAALTECCETAEISIASLAEIEQCRVAPDIFVTMCIQESPTWRQCEVLESAGATLRQVGYVERVKKVWNHSNAFTQLSLCFGHDSIATRFNHGLLVLFRSL